MPKFRVDIEKSIASTLLILEKLGGTCDFHKVFKILYFADQKHIAKYGRPVTGDGYIAMKNGPVPTNMYDILKAIKSDSLFNESAKEYKQYFDVKFYFVSGKTRPDLDFLSETDIDCLLESISENKDLDFLKLTDKSHDFAYDGALRDDVISVTDIARAGGADETMIDYIELNIQNQRAFN